MSTHSSSTKCTVHHLGQLIFRKFQKRTCTDKTKTKHKACWEKRGLNKMSKPGSC